MSTNQPKISIKNLFNRNALPKLTEKERQETVILVVEPEITVRNSIKQLLMGLGFGATSDAADYAMALQKLEQRHFTHIIFDAKSNNMPASEFLNKVLDYDEDLIAIAASSEPSLDDVFDLLVIGAKGYLVKPCNEQSVEDAIIMATKAEPISDAILHAKDRNEALVSLIMTNIDRVATILRQSRQFETAKLELNKARMSFKRSVDIGRQFAKGGEEKLLEKILEFALDRSTGPATKLGRARKKRKTKSIPKTENNATNAA